LPAQQLVSAPRYAPQGAAADAFAAATAALLDHLDVRSGPRQQSIRLILNLIWLVLCGWWTALACALDGLICFVLIITIPFGIAAFRIGGYVLWPFGRLVPPPVPRRGS